MSLCKVRCRRGWKTLWLASLTWMLGGTDAVCADPPVPPPVVPAQPTGPAAPTETLPPPNPHAGDPARLPIDLPYALRQVNAGNPTIAIAQERVREAYARQRQAQVLWLPNLWAGGNPENGTFLPDYYVHDGKIQNSTGNVFNTSKSNAALPLGTGLNLSFANALFAPRIARNLTAAEAARARGVTYNVQLDVALTYLDLLRVYGALAINAETLTKAEQMLQLASQAQREGLGKTTADANRARTEVELRRQERIDLEGDAAIVSSRLAQLLLLEPTVDLVPADAQVLPIELVPADQPLDELVGIGLLNRPELAESRALVAAALARWRQDRTRPLLPTLQMVFYTADFGGGTPGQHNFGWRDDFLIQASWELRNGGLGNLFQAREARSQFNQANLHVVEVQAQVAAEVTAAAKLVRGRQRALAPAQEAVRQAEEMWARLSRAAFGIAGPARQYDPLEPLLAEQALHQARMQYLTEVIEFNRNQFRLYWALGQPPECALPKATTLPVSVPLPASPARPGEPASRPASPQP